ncbi:MAG: PAS domain S-box protein [Ardenticatenaceae bacterium]|nr:PAS domain S-box protein [Ardenticatenaceae bacterium]MCB9444221.1 PAS domain S-box protein [Ardenticatenaceae bacterium]
MDWQFTSYSIFNFLIAGLTAAVAYISWQRRHVTGGRPLFWLMTAVSFWMLVAGVEAAAVQIPDKVFWSKIQYLGIQSSPVFLFLFALQFAECDNCLSRRLQKILWILPITIILLAFTNEYHHLIWTTFTPILGTNLIQYGHGWAFWVAIAYIYLLVVSASIILVRASLSRRHIFRNQVKVILIGLIFPWLGNIIYVFDLGPPSYDFTSIGFALIGIILLWSVQNTRLLDLIPVARSKLVDTMTDAMVVLDERSRLIDVNPAAEAIIGQPAAAVIGKDAAQVFRFQPQLLRCLTTTTEKQVETAVTHNGSAHYYDLNVSPLHDYRNRVSGRVLVWREITGRKRVEEALRQTNQELEARNADLDAFSHMVAHDLKNPVAAINGLADLLADPRTEPEQYQEYIHDIEQIGQKMGSIIDELMLLAGLRKANVQMASVDVAGIMANVEVRLAQLIKESGGRLRYSETWPLALGHGPWVEEVLANYVSNALKYGGQPPCVEMGATQMLGNRVRFWVRDNGPGLAPEQQAKLFTEFERLGRTRATGYGLGLSIVRRIMEKMDGDYGVESTAVPGEGCTFYFTLPGFPLN